MKHRQRLCEVMAALQAEIEGLRAREGAARLEAERTAPGTRENFFQTPAAASNLTQRSEQGGALMDILRQIQFAENIPTPKPKESSGSSKMPQRTANALVGKALTAFEDKNQKVQIQADSPWNAVIQGASGVCWQLLDVKECRPLAVGFGCRFAAALPPSADG